MIGHAGHLVPLADFNQNKVTPGLLGFVVFAAIAGACWLLMKSMNKQFKKIDFEETPQAASDAVVAADADAGASGTSGAKTA
ncbi:MAG: hypothetical protein JO362_07660 [Streptomycetaceae bacterium]|nr:hypothetical protein [Streptomycetaceae bacterium]